MKKIKFLNGIGGMCAFAVIALVGSLLFTSCEKEDLNATIFEPEPAKATINVNVIAYPSGSELSNVGITADKGTVSGMVVTIPAGADKNIAAQEVTISATAPAGYEPILSVKVKINALKAGGVATYSATMVAVKTSDPVEPDQVVIAATEEDGATIVSSMVNPTHNHAGNDWWENANDYILITKVSYILYNEQSVATNTVTGVDVTNFVKGLTYDHNKESVLNMKISAWSLYRAWFEVYPSTTTYNFSYKNSGTQLGSIVFKTKRGTSAQSAEIAHPSHAHAYQHGHGHGASENAGGGIVLPD